MNIQSDALIMIDDLETLRVISDPLRLKIYQAVSDANKSGALCSVKQISDEVDVPPAKLYYHVKLLENHGLLQVADTRIVSGILEKLYQVRAYKLMVSNDLFGREGVSEALYPLFAGLINEVMGDIQHILNKPQKEFSRNNIALSQIKLRLPKNRITEFSEKFEQVIKEIEQQASQSEDEETDRYSFFYAFYPDEKPLKKSTNTLSNEDVQ